MRFFPIKFSIGLVPIGKLLDTIYVFAHMAYAQFSECKLIGLDKSLKRSELKRQLKDKDGQ